MIARGTPARHARLRRRAGRPAGGTERETRSPEETERLGAAFAVVLRAGDVLGLTGTLGSGKTRFVAGLARGLDAGGRVRSPTFTLVNEYTGRLTLFHVDLYRLDASEAVGLGLEELAGRGAIVVEWAERLPGVWRDEALEISFEVVDASRRRLVARGQAPRALELLDAWRGLAPAPAAP